jgi:hypothetical protein
MTVWSGELRRVELRPLFVTCLPVRRSWVIQCSFASRIRAFVAGLTSLSKRSRATASGRSESLASFKFFCFATLCFLVRSAR